MQALYSTATNTYTTQDWLRASENMPLMAFLPGSSVSSVFREHSTRSQLLVADYLFDQSPPPFVADIVAAALHPSPLQRSHQLVNLARKVAHAQPISEGLEEWASSLAEDLAKFTD
jgi:hypothetical protein